MVLLSFVSDDRTPRSALANGALADWIPFRFRFRFFFLSLDRYGDELCTRLDRRHALL